jgi:hypothetical protein
MPTNKNSVQDIKICPLLEFSVNVDFLTIAEVVVSSVLT